MPHAPGPSVQCVGCVAHPLGVATAARHRTCVLRLRRGPCFGKLMFLSLCVKSCFQKNLTIRYNKQEVFIGEWVTPMCLVRKSLPRLLYERL